MKVLVLGAGAMGGYYGGRLAAAGVDVTFLVREPRKAKLVANGLKIVSPRGDAEVQVKAVTKNDAPVPFDAVLLGCKAYDLDAAIKSLQSVVSNTPVILPLLNGMRHLDILDREFGEDSVLGGSCQISATLGPNGEIRHFSEFDILTFGPRHETQTTIAEDLKKTLERGHFKLRYRTDIVTAMWEKWVLLATLAAITTLMRAGLNEIVATDFGRIQILTLIEHCASIASAAGHPPGDEMLARVATVLTDPNSDMVASMLRDMERRHPTEADHIIGDLIRRGRKMDIPSPILEMAFTHLQIYANRKSLDRVERS